MAVGGARVRRGRKQIKPPLRRPPQRGEGQSPLDRQHGALERRAPHSEAGTLVVSERVSPWSGWSTRRPRSESGNKAMRRTTEHCYGFGAGESSRHSTPIGIAVRPDEARCCWCPPLACTDCSITCAEIVSVAPDRRAGAGRVFERERQLRNWRRRGARVHDSQKLWSRWQSTERPRPSAK